MLMPTLAQSSDFLVWLTSMLLCLNAKLEIKDLKAYLNGLFCML